MTAAILGHMVFAFVAAASLFWAIGWYTRDGQDRIYRANLDRLVDALDAIPLSDLAHRFLRRFLDRWEAAFPATGPGLLRFLALSAAVNASFMIAAALSPGLLGLGLDLIGPVLLTAGVYALIGLVPDILAAKASYAMLRGALRATGGMRLVGALVLDCLFLGTAAIFNMLLTVFYLDATSEKPWPTAAAVWEAISDLPRSIAVDWSEYPLLVVLQVVGASIQTLLYLILGLCAMSARVCPRPLQQVLSRCVYNVTTDGTPVFTQLGNMVGGVAALLTALLDLIRPA